MNTIHDHLDKLQKLYSSKCLQLQKAKNLPNSCWYMVLQAEAKSLKNEIDKF